MVNARSGGSTESFLYKKSQKKWPKVKDLSENLPPCLSRAAMASPKFWSMGGGGGAAALTAHSWIRHWCGGVFNDRYVRNVLLSVPGKAF